MFMTIIQRTLFPCVVSQFLITNISTLFDNFAGSMHEMQFLRLNNNDGYNNNMNSVDIRDQLLN